MKKLQDKVAVFIGGGSAVATVALRHFMNEGAKVVLVDVDEKYFTRSEDLRAAYPERIRTFIGACTEQADMDAAMAFAEKEFGKIDILCNYAGFHGGGNIATVQRGQWQLAMDVTCLGIYRAVKAVYPYMKKHQYGRIMNFASIGGRANRGVPVTYAGFKAAAIGITRALAYELAPDNITINSMAPATLNTSAFERIPEKGSIPMKPPKGALKGGPGATMGGSFISDRPTANLDEIAHVILFMCSDDSAFLTGDCLDVNGGQFMQP